MRTVIGAMACIAVVLSIGCMKSPTAPEGGGPAVSPLGYHIQTADYEGDITPAHGEFADRWWTELMMDLRNAGYSEAQTDPSKNVEWVYIYLYRPRDGDASIVCPGRSDLVGACYDQLKPAFRVPGNYIDGPMLGRRPSSQPLKHEMLHHWCYRTLHHMCMQPGASEWDGHHWSAPDGTDIWNFTWK